MTKTTLMMNSSSRHFSSMLVFLLSTVVLVMTSTTTTTTTTSSFPFFVMARQQTSLFSKPFTSSVTNLNHAACVTLFTREGKQGCGTSSRDVHKGVVVQYQNTNHQSALEDPYVLVLKETLLGKELMETILATNTKGLLQGILVANTTTTSSSSSSTPYSPSSRSPNGKRTPSQYLNYGNAAYGWNIYGDSLLQLDFKGIPMAYIVDSDISQALLNDGDTTEANGPIMAEISYYMGPLSEIDSYKCLAWKDVADDVWRPKCLPLGGQSVWATTISTSSTSISSNGGRALQDEQRVQDQEQATTTPDQNEETKTHRKLQSGGVFFLTASMDANSLFHDATPATNEAATNILTVLMAAKLIGTVDQSLFSTNKIVVALFQGESFGFLGSRRFLKDITAFSCNSSPVPSVGNNKTSTMACLNPLRPSLEFTKILQNDAILGMLSVDQVGVLATSKTLYVHTDGSDYGATLSTFLQGSSSSDTGYTVTEVEAAADDDHFDANDITIPPTPLTSLLSVSGGAYGGAVLTGYASAFTAPYGTHLNSASYLKDKLDMTAIATAATLLARTAVAAAVNNGDADTAIATALTAIPNVLTSSDTTLVALADCLYYNGHCDLLQSYARVEAATETKHTGHSISSGTALGTPPNYYVSVLDSQPYVMVNNRAYGRYQANSDDKSTPQYGKSSTDAVLVHPSLLENAIRGLLQDFLGRPYNAASSSSLKKCSRSTDCSKVSYCASSDGTTVINAICTGGNVCVCPQAHFHVAMDEAIEPALNNGTGYFQVVSGDDKLSALYTEPYWDAHVGIQLYDSNTGTTTAGTTVALSLGISVLVVSLGVTYTLRRMLIKEKLY